MISHRPQRDCHARWRCLGLRIRPQIVGTLGAVIMPHNLYLHSGLVLSRRVHRSSEQRIHEALWYSRIESAGALLFAFFINLSVIVTNSAKFFAPACASADGGPYACLSPNAHAHAHYT